MFGLRICKVDKKGWGWVGFIKFNMFIGVIYFDIDDFLWIVNYW